MNELEIRTKCNACTNTYNLINGVFCLDCFLEFVDERPKWVNLANKDLLEQAFQQVQNMIPIGVSFQIRDIQRVLEPLVLGIPEISPRIVVGIDFGHGDQIIYQVMNITPFGTLQVIAPAQPFSDYMHTVNRSLFDRIQVPLGRQTFREFSWSSQEIFRLMTMRNTEISQIPSPSQLLGND